LRQIRVFLLLAVILLAGCGAPGTRTKSVRVAPQTEFQSDFSASCGELSFGGSWNSKDTGCFVLSLQYPEALTGTVYTCNGDAVTLTFGSQTQAVNLGELPQEGLPRVLFEIFRACSAGQVLGDPVQQDGLWCFSGICIGKAFTLRTDDSGAVHSVSVEQAGLTVDFLSDE